MFVIRQFCFQSINECESKYCRTPYTTGGNNHTACKYCGIGRLCGSSICQYGLTAVSKVVLLKWQNKIDHTKRFIHLLKLYVLCNLNMSHKCFFNVNPSAISLWKNKVELLITVCDLKGFNISDRKTIDCENTQWIPYYCCPRTRITGCWWRPA